MNLVEKLLYYRREKKLSQENLADILCVSRQTITKWESGTSIPQIEYLISMAKLYGITVDYLVKEDEYLPKINLSFEKKEVIDFLIKAKQHTYAAKNGKVDSSRKQSHDLSFEEGKYLYYDTFLGSEYFSGQEGIWENNKPFWTMNYYGKVIDEGFSGDFLKEALLKIPYNCPFRGPTYYRHGEYTYCCNSTGDFNEFTGKEYIYYHDNCVYQCIFHGGIVK